MKEKYVRRTQPNNTEFLQSKGFSPAMAAVVASRGVTEDNYDEYFDDKLCFHAPEEMTNMTEAAELIRLCMENDGSVLICGDYDADGLSASALLSLYFSDNGIFNTVLIPTRDEGYGLHANAVINAFGKHFYDLVITVDCGISNADEVARIRDELGVEVIVTDHHELPEQLPDCICVNPKIGYPFAYLSGSGVAWKLVEALTDRQTAMRYVDLASIGTIGDIMPMQDENRAIVKSAIANWNHKGLRKLGELSKCPQTLTSTDIAMRIVPKINAAGRIGDPYAALELLLMRDKVDTASCEKLLAMNDTRKEYLDDIVAEADKMIDPEEVRKQRIVYLAGNKWQHGLLGIAAAKYKEKYYVPAVVMTDDGDNYVGSARGIDEVDLFDAFRRCKDLLVKFGGHKASVGFTVAKENVDALGKALSAVFCELPEEVFVKNVYYDVEIGDDATVQEVYKLQNFLQPMLPQDKILCRVRDSVKFANSFGKDGAHLSVTLASGLEVKGFFKYGVLAPYIKHGANVDLVCGVDMDSYTHNVTGIVEDMTLVNSVCFDDFYKLNFVKNCVCDNFTDVTFDKVAADVANSVCVVFDDYETYLANVDKLCLQDYAVDIFFKNADNSHVAVISPLPDYDYSGFEKVVYCHGFSAHLAVPDGTAFVQTEPANKDLYTVGLTRNVCTSAYSALRKKGDYDSIKSVYDKQLLGKITYPQYIAALRVFGQLGLVEIVDQYTVRFNNGARAELDDSEIYRLMKSEE